MVRFFLVMVFVASINTAAQAKKNRIFNPQSFMRILDTSCITTKFDKNSFKLYTKETLAIVKELDRKILRGMAYADIGYMAVIDKDDYKKTRIIYTLTMGDRAKPKMTYCTIMFRSNAGDAVSQLLQNKYDAKFLKEYSQGLSTTKMLIANLIGYKRQVIFSIQHSKEADTTIISMFYRPIQ